ncbi:MAG: hypothetical protein ACLQVX_13560 [Limisphaerales bacterium]
MSARRIYLDNSATTPLDPRVVQAMGFDRLRARGSLRVTLGRFNTDAGVEVFLQVLPEKVRDLRSIATYPNTTINKGA